MNQRLVFNMWVFFSVLLFVSPGESGYCRYDGDIGQYGMGCIQRQAQGFRPPGHGDEGVYEDDSTFDGEVTTAATGGGEVVTTGANGPEHGEAGHTHNAAAEKSILEGELDLIRPWINRLRDFRETNIYRRKRTERFAMIKRYNCHTNYFDTYLVDLDASNGPAILDKFATTVSARGVGCRTEQMRPGIFKLNAYGKDCQKRGASRKAWWGNDHKVFCQVRVDGMRSCNCPDCFMHSNNKMQDPCKHPSVVAQTGRRVCTPHPKKPKASKSIGCTVTTDEFLAKLLPGGEYDHMPGNLLVYNPTKAEFSKQAAECRGPRR